MILRWPLVTDSLSLDETHPHVTRDFLSFPISGNLVEIWVSKRKLKRCSREWPNSYFLAFAITRIATLPYWIRPIFWRWLVILIFSCWKLKVTSTIPVQVWYVQMSYIMLPFFEIKFYLIRLNPNLAPFGARFISVKDEWVFQVYK